ncbi:response regulator [bacterium]|nr:MAG: response regulator [bacterium]
MSNVLIVDDFKTQRMYLQSICNELMLSSIEASNGKEAVEILNKQSVSLVITDNDMPEMTGIELISHIKTDPKHKSLPVIMISSNVGVSGEAKAKGASVFIKKPFDKNQVVSAIHQSLSTNKSKRQYNVLLIDDVQLQTAIWEKLLTMDFFNYVSAHSAQEGLNKLRSQPFDLIITDFAMPNVDGERFIKKIKSMPEFAKIPVILISSHELTKATIPTGVDSFFQKPFNPQDVKAAIRQAVKWGV